MRVRFLIPDPLEADSRAAREAQALVEAGHDVTIIAPAGGSDPGAIPAKGKRSGGVHACGPRRRGWPLKPVIALASWVVVLIALWRSRPEVIHVYGRRAILRAWLVSRLRGALLVYDAAGHANPRRWRPLRERLLLRRCRAVIADSSGAAQRVRDLHGLTALPLIVHDAPDVPASGIPQANLRERLGIEQSRLVLHDARREETGYRQLVEALAELPGTHVVALCEPQHADRLRLFAERHRVAGRVHVIRGVAPKRLPSYAMDADAAVCFPDPGRASESDPPPMQLLRYVAAGRRVVASAAVGDHMRAAGVVTVDPSDRGAVAQALRDALAAPDLPLDATSAHWSTEAQKLVGLYTRLDTLPPLRSDKHERQPVRARLAGVRTEAGGLVAGGKTHPRAAVLYAKGRELRAAGRFLEAERAFARAVELHPTNDNYWYHHAAALRDSNRPVEAIAAYRKVIELNDSRPRAIVVTTAVALARLGIRQEPAEVLAALERLSTKTPQALIRIGELQSALGQIGLAVASIAEASRSPLEPALEKACLRVLEQCGQLSAALEVATRVSDVPSERRLAGALRVFDPAWRPGPPVPRRWLGPATDTTVLHLLETALPYATSGYTYRTSTVLSAQRRAGLRPVAVTRLGFPVTRGVHSHSALELVDGVAHHCLTLQGVTRYTSIPLDERVERNVALLAPLIEEVRPAVLHATSPHFNGLLALALREAFGSAFVYEARGFPDMTWAARPGGDQVESYSLRRQAETRCMLEADAVITLSKVMRDHIVERGVPAERVFVVPHMVDTERFSPRPKDQALVERYGLEGKTVVGYVSSLVDYEGVDTLLRGIAEARRARPEIVGLIVGDGHSMAALQTLAKELEIEDSVRFAGRVPHVETIEHYALIDIFVVPRKGLEVCAFVTPLKPFEAMAMERCLVVSDLPALAETVAGGDHGVVFTPESPESLAAALTSLASDDDRRADMGKRARAFVETHHSFAMSPEVTSQPISFAKEHRTSEASSGYDDVGEVR